MAGAGRVVAAAFFVEEPEHVDRAFFGRGVDAIAVEAGVLEIFDDGGEAVGVGLGLGGGEPADARFVGGAGEGEQGEGWPSG